MGDRRIGRQRRVARGSTLALALAFVVVIAGSAGNASGAVTGLQRVHADSPSSSDAFRFVTATCPAGKRVLGGGAELFGGESQVSLNDVIPNGALTTVTAEAFEDQTGHTGSWTLRAYAICATAPPGLERVLATSPTDSTNKTVSATCPAGKRLLGAGGGVSGGAGQVMAQDIRIDSLTRVTSQGVEDQDGTPVNWQLRAYAICSNPVHMLERVVATSPSDSLKGKGVTTTCPAGKRVVGAGGEVGGIEGQVALNDLKPSDTLRDVTAHASEDEDGTLSNWLVRAFAVCAAVSERFVTTTPTDSEQLKSLVSECPTDLRATGGGADVVGGGGQVRVDGSFPLDDLDPGLTSVGWFADALEDENGYAAAWFLRALAICATPLPGLQAVSTGDSDSSTTKSVTATCPAGTRVVGAGGGIVSDGPVRKQVVLEELAPNAALTSVTATGHEDETGEDQEWFLFAQPVCANPPPGLELVSAISPVNSSNKTVTATCPAGKNLLGTGADIDGGLGQVVLDEITPTAELTNVLVTGLEDETGHTGAWSVRSYAICANP
jgi:hypothetical protein